MFFIYLNIFSYMSSLKNFLNKYCWEIAIIIIAIIAFFSIFSEILNPTYIDWIIMDGMDTYQHYYAWEFYRGQSLNYPFGIIKRIAPPIGIPLVYMDAIPLFAFIFAPFSDLLPPEFQYFGIFILISFVLIGFWSFKLLNHITGDKLLSLIGAIFFIFSPIMLYRSGGHASLTAHWIIITAFYLSLLQYKTIYWLILLLLAFLVHPYLFLIIAPIMLINLFYNSFWTRNIPLTTVVSSLIIQIVFLSATAYSIGLWHIYSAKSQGFGEYSFNLNGFWNPYWGDWSLFLPNLETSPYQFEGFAYLGLGMIMLSITALFFILKNYSLRDVRSHIYKFFPYYILAVFYLLYAVSTPAFYGTTVIYNFGDLPVWIEKILNVARGSGRFIWPLYYGIFIFSIYFITSIKTPWRYFVLGFALIIQLVDISNHVWEFQNKRYENKIWNHQLTEILETNGTSYEHINFLPIFPWYGGTLAEEDYSAYFEFAKKHDLTVNSALTARIVKGGNKHIKNQIQDVVNGNIQKDTIYVILEDRKDLLKFFDTNDSTFIYRDKSTIVFP